MQKQKFKPWLMRESSMDIWIIRLSQPRRLPLNSSYTMEQWNE